MGYEEELKAILNKYPEIFSINLELKTTMRITNDLQQAPLVQPVKQQVNAPIRKPIIPAVENADLINKLRGNAYVEEINVINE